MILAHVYLYVREKPTRKGHKPMLSRSLKVASFASLVAAYQPALRMPQPQVARRHNAYIASRVSMAAVESPPPGGPAVVEAPAEPIHLPSNEENENLLRIRHTSAHVMAMAVQRLFKDAQVTIGPWIEKGFYYDFDREEPFLEKDLRRIKKEMDKIIKMKLPLTREEVSKEEAERRIREINEVSRHWRCCCAGW